MGRRQTGSDWEPARVANAKNVKNKCKSALWAGGRPGATGSGRERIKPLMVKQCPKGPIQLINIVLFVFMLLLHYASCAQQKYEHTASAHQRDQNSACIYHSQLGNVRIRRLKLFVMLLVVRKATVCLFSYMYVPICSTSDAFLTCHTQSMRNVSCR